jgi:DNA-binding NtrC family response regulator
MGGFAVLKHITERHPETQVIVISGQADVERDDMLALGAFEFFAKPFQLDEVEAAVQTAIAHREQLKSAAATRLSEAY